MDTAQASYDEMLCGFIAPELRSWGFTGTRGRYQRPDPAAWVLLGFQKSVYSDRVGLRFTLNLSTIDRSQWADYRQGHPAAPAKPSPSTFYGVWARQTRIGALTDRGEDRWWTMTASTALDRLSAEVLLSIRDLAIPWLSGSAAK